MPYSLRDTWPDRTDRCDYVIRCEGLEIGRVYFAREPDGDRWLWAIYMNGHVAQINDVPISGLAVTHEEAASQLNQSYEAMRTMAGLPRPQR